MFYIAYVGKATNNKWAYDLTYHFVVDLELQIALAFMIYVVDFINEKSSTTLLMNARVLHYTTMRLLIVIQNYICILMTMTIYECSFLYIDMLSLVLLSLNCM